MPCRVTKAQLKTVLHLKSSSHFHTVSLSLHPPSLHPASVFFRLLFCAPLHPSLHPSLPLPSPPTTLPHMKRLSGRTSHEAVLAHAQKQFHKLTHKHKRRRRTNTELLMNEQCSDPLHLFTSLADEKFKSEKNESR